MFDGKKATACYKNDDNSDDVDDGDDDKNDDNHLLSEGNTVLIAEWETGSVTGSNDTVWEDDDYDGDNDYDDYHFHQCGVMVRMAPFIIILTRECIMAKHCLSSTAARFLKLVDQLLLVVSIVYDDEDDAAIMII